MTHYYSSFITTICSSINHSWIADLYNNDQLSAFTPRYVHNVLYHWARHLSFFHACTSADCKGIFMKSCIIVVVKLLSLLILCKLLLKSNDNHHKCSYLTAIRVEVHHFLCCLLLKFQCLYIALRSYALLSSMWL